jgi:hypothetical protein
VNRYSIFIKYLESTSSSILKRTVNYPQPNKAIQCDCGDGVSALSVAKTEPLNEPENCSDDTVSSTQSNELTSRSNVLILGMSYLFFEEEIQVQEIVNRVMTNEISR